MSANPAAEQSVAGANTLPLWDIDASAPQASIGGACAPENTSLQPIWDIDSARCGTAGVAIALAVMCPPGTPMAEISQFVQALNRGERELGGQGIKLVSEECCESDSGIVVIALPVESKGANGRLQKLIEPLGGDGSIGRWSRPGPNRNDLARQLLLDPAPAADAICRVESLGSSIRVQVVAIELS